MENCSFVYLADESSETDLEYYEFQKIIKRDFQRLIYIFENYKNNEQLINEFNNVVENICNFRKLLLDFRIALFDEYLYFDYDDDKSNFITVIMKRDMSEFYFVYRLNPQNGTIINSFSKENKKINYKKYKDGFNSSLFKNLGYSNDNFIRNSILDLTIF